MKVSLEHEFKTGKKDFKLEEAQSELQERIDKEKQQEAPHRGRVGWTFRGHLSAIFPKKGLNHEGRLGESGSSPLPKLKSISLGLHSLAVATSMGFSSPFLLRKDTRTCPSCEPPDTSNSHISQTPPVALLLSSVLK